MDKGVMHNLSYGLFVLTAKDGVRDNGCIVNTVIQVTTEPNRIMVAVNKSNLTHDMILKTREFNVSILTENSKFEVFKHFGFQSGKNVDKFNDVPINFNRSTNGLIYLLDDVNSYISAKVISVTDLGSHSLFLADVLDGEVLSKEPSTTYAYYHKNIKINSKPIKKSHGFICTVCGYVYEGDVLPEDFICPWCKHPASDFKIIE